MADPQATTPGARDYVITRAIFRLTQRAIEAVTLCVSRGPLSPLTQVQSIQMRVALATIMREAVSVGRWFERVRNGSKEPEPNPRVSSRPKSQTIIVSPEMLSPEDPGFDEDSTTEPLKPR